MSAQSATRSANILAKYLDTEELEQIAMCFDNIRQMRSLNSNMVDNDDTALGDQFDECLSGMIADLTEQLKDFETSGEKSEARKAVISGKRDLMQLLVDKTLEYLRVVDPQAEIVLTDLATQYESLIDAAMSAEPSVGNNKNQSKQLKEKDQEIKRLKEQLKKQQSSPSKDIEKEVLRKKVKELEQENRQLRTRLSQNSKNSASGKAPASAMKPRPKTATAVG